MTTIAEQTAVQQIQAYADDMIPRAHRHFAGQFQLGVPRCLWKRAQLGDVATVTTKGGHGARLIPVAGYEFQTFPDPWDVVIEKLAKDLEVTL